MTDEERATLARHTEEIRSLTDGRLEHHEHIKTLLETVRVLGSAVDLLLHTKYKEPAK